MGGITDTYPALAASIDLTPGHTLADRLCASCHDIGDGSKPVVFFAPPSFAAIVADPAATELGLRAFHRTMKEDMPTFVLTPAEIDDIVAYMLSLRPSQPGSRPSQPSILRLPANAPPDQPERAAAD
jgi:mono/diheme cytochrome c family protein